jgi:hypothetical protein
MKTALGFKLWALGLLPFTQSDPESIGRLIKALVVEHAFGCQRAV